MRLLSLASPAASAGFASFVIEGLKTGELFTDLDFKPSVDGLVPLHVLEPFGHVDLAGGKGAGLVMRIAVALMVAELLHELRGGVSQIHGHGARAVRLHEGPHRIVGVVDGVALGGAGQINDGLRDGELPFGRAQTLIDFSRLGRRAA